MERAPDSILLRKADADGTDPHAPATLDGEMIRCESRIENTGTGRGHLAPGGPPGVERRHRDDDHRDLAAYVRVDGDGGSSTVTCTERGPDAGLLHEVSPAA